LVEYTKSGNHHPMDEPLATLCNVSGWKFSYSSIVNGWTYLANSVQCEWINISLLYSMCVDELLAIHPMWVNEPLAFPFNMIGWNFSFSVQCE
jgi:hypothetical protein